MVFIIDQIRHLMNKFKMLSFAYISDGSVYDIDEVIFGQIF